MESNCEKMIVTDVAFALKSYYAAPMSYEYCAEVRVKYKNTDYFVMACYNDYGSEIIVVKNKEMLSAWIKNYDEFSADDKCNIFFEANDFTMEGYDEEDIPEEVVEATRKIVDSEFCNAIRFARMCADTFHNIDTADEEEHDPNESATAARKNIESLGYLNEDINAKKGMPYPSYLSKEFKVAEIVLFS